MKHIFSLAWIFLATLAFADGTILRCTPERIREIPNEKRSVDFTRIDPRDLNEECRTVTFSVAPKQYCHAYVKAVFSGEDPITGDFTSFRYVPCDQNDFLETESNLD